MARIQTFAKDVQLATAGLSQEQIAPALANFARAELQSAISEGIGSPTYTKYVNGREGADEGTVVPPGPIVYDFIWWREIVEYALQVLVENSPIKTGRYQSSWVVLQNGFQVSNWNAIPINAQVMLVNTQPYARKIDTGFMDTRGYLGVDRARRSVMSLFGNMVMCRGTMVELPSGPPPAPYTLRGIFKRGIRPFARKKLRADTRAGAAMKYPALRIEMRT